MLHKNIYNILINKQYMYIIFYNVRSSHSEVFLEKDVLKIRSKFTGEQLCSPRRTPRRTPNFIEITLRHGCSPVNLLQIFRTSFTKNTSGWLLSQYLMGYEFIISIKKNQIIPFLNKISLSKDFWSISAVYKMF